MNSSFGTTVARRRRPHFRHSLASGPLTDQLCTSRFGERGISTPTCWGLLKQPDNKKLYSDSNTGGTMSHRIVHLMCVVVLTTAAYAQQSHWATPDDKTAKFMIDMERKWAEGVCANNGVISELLGDDFQGTSTGGERYTK